MNVAKKLCDLVEQKKEVITSARWSVATLGSTATPLVYLPLILAFKVAVN